MSGLAEPLVWRIETADESGTREAAEQVAGLVGAGDLVTLTGDLGAGKTAFARALIRKLTGDPDLDVPSPTFTLMQVYETEKFPIVHADLYRIGNPSELTELGWDEATDSALVLVEWAERAGGALPAERLDVRLTISPGSDDKRIIELSGFGAFAARLAPADDVHRHPPEARHPVDPTHPVAPVPESKQIVLADRLHRNVERRRRGQR